MSSHTLELELQQEFHISPKILSVQIHPLRRKRNLNRNTLGSCWQRNFVIHVWHCESESIRGIMVFNLKQILRRYTGHIKNLWHVCTIYLHSGSERRVISCTRLSFLCVGAICLGWWRCTMQYHQGQLATPPFFPSSFFSPLIRYALPQVVSINDIKQIWWNFFLRPDTCCMKYSAAIKTVSFNSLWRHVGFFNMIKDNFDRSKCCYALT